MKLERLIAKILKQKKATLAVAESITGGLISHRLTNLAGCSVYLRGVLVSYQDAIKCDLLKIPHKVIQAEEVVSKKVAILMAEKVRKLFQADYGLATTGIAGPGGATKKSPIGTVWIAVADSKNTKAEKFYFQGERIQIKEQAACAALEVLKNKLCS